MEILKNCPAYAENIHEWTVDEPCEDFNQASAVTFLFLREDRDDDTAAKERDDLRYSRHKERERERRIARAAPEKRCVVLPMTVCACMWA